MGKILLFDVPLGEVHCDVCYEEFVLPLEIIEDIHGEKIVCSRCKSEQMLDARKTHLAQEHRPDLKLPAPICECGFSLDRCHAENCNPGTPTAPGQGKLF